jgi:hypothetical protein
MEMETEENDMAKNMYQIAQEITDEVLGKGAYVKMNKFDPSKGQTHQGDRPAIKQRPQSKRKTNPASKVR